MSRAECLTYLDFLPTLTSTPVLLPPSLSLVIADSLSKHTLADPSTSGYNHRVAEVSLAALMLDRAWGGHDMDKDEHQGRRKRLTLRDAVLRAKFASGNEEEDVRCALSKLEVLLPPHPKDSWTGKEIVDHFTELGAPDLVASFPILRSGGSLVALVAMQRWSLTVIALKPGQRFDLHKRTKHTYEEVLRLTRFIRICRTLQEGNIGGALESSDPKEEYLCELGALVSATHTSLRDLYDATVPPVDQLQDLCLKHGALGSRQMGKSCRSPTLPLASSRFVFRLEFVSRAHRAQQCTPTARLTLDSR